MRHRTNHTPDMVRSASEEFPPIASLPESEPLHVVIIIAHRRISIWGTLQIKVDKFLEVGSHNLVGVDENDFMEVHWEEHIQKQDFISPNDTLLLGLCAQP